MLELNVEENEYLLKCRCGGQFIFTEQDAQQGYDVVGCDTCSLQLQVLYDELSQD